MCGIAGYIGVSKDAELTHILITVLFDYLEIRGNDAAGVWGVSKDGNKIYYHKDGIRSSLFIKKKFWKEKIAKADCDILLTHARATSGKNGHAKVNKNNHPFVSSDYSIGLIHNGTLAESEHLEKIFERESNTDSEFLLRIFENSDKNVFNMDRSKVLNNWPYVPDYIKNIVCGVQDIWSAITGGSMAVAVGQVLPNCEDLKILSLFRNSKRPLWVADLRQWLGQIFFFSSTKIWSNLLWSRQIKDNKELSAMVEDCYLYEIPPSELWMFESTGRAVIFRRLKIKTTPSKDISYESIDKKIEIKENDPIAEVVEADANDVIKDTWGKSVDSDCTGSYDYGGYGWYSDNNNKKKSNTGMGQETNRERRNEKGRSRNSTEKNWYDPDSGFTYYYDNDYSYEDDVIYESENDRIKKQSYDDDDDNEYVEYDLSDDSNKSISYICSEIVKDINDIDELSFSLSGIMSKEDIKEIKEQLSIIEEDTRAILYVLECIKNREYD